MIAESEWKRRADLRNQWADFQKTEAFASGVDVLRNYATPFVQPGESLNNMATRQAYQAGFAACLHLLNNISTLHTKGATDKTLREWDWIEKTTDSSD